MRPSFTSFLMATFGTVVAAVLLGPAAIANADESAQETIDRLQSEGYTVILDKIGTGPIDSCTVTSVRNPRQSSQLVPYFVSGFGIVNEIVLPQVTSRTISVSLDCSR